MITQNVRGENLKLKYKKERASGDLIRQPFGLTDEVSARRHITYLYSSISSSIILAPSFMPRT